MTIDFNSFFDRSIKEIDLFMQDNWESLYLKYFKIYFVNQIIQLFHLIAIDKYIIILPIFLKKKQLEKHLKLIKMQ